MAISVDESVARWSGSVGSGIAVESAAFTPPDNSLLVVVGHSDSSSASGHTGVNFSMSGGGLTWTERVKRHVGDSGASDGAAVIFTAPVGTGAEMTIEATRTWAAGSNLTMRVSYKLYIVTGQHATDPIGAVGEGTSTTNNLTASLTAEGAGRLFGGATDWNALGIPASSDTEDAAHYTGEISVLSAYKSADHASGSQSINFNASGSSAADWSWVLLEILAAAGGADATAALTGVSSTGAAGEVTLTAGATAALTGVEASGAAGDPTLFGSAVVDLAGVAAQGQAGVINAEATVLAELTGVSATGAAGDFVVTGDAAVEIEGVAATGVAGDPVVDTDGSTSVVLSGVSATGTAGALDVTGDATATLDGVEASSQAGEVTVSTGANAIVQLSGVAATCAAGDMASVTGDALVAPSGVAATGDAGGITIVVPDVTVVLTGVQAIGSAGTLTAARKRVTITLGSVLRDGVVAADARKGGITAGDALKGSITKSDGLT